MASHTIHGLFADDVAAVAVVRDLEAAGIDSDDISLIANQVPRQDDLNHRKVEDAIIDVAPDETLPGVGTAASVGAASGATVGLLAGIGAIAIPGLGPVLGAGWLVSTILGAGIGAASGGLIGALTETGVSGPDADFYNSEIALGRALVTVKAADDEVATVEAVMRTHGRMYPPAGPGGTAAAAVLPPQPAPLTPGVAVDPKVSVAA